MSHPYGMPFPAPMPARARLWPRVRHQLIILGALFSGALLLGILRNRAGLLAVALAWVVIGFIANRGWRVAIEYAAVAGLVLALGAAGAAAPNVRAAADRPAPKAEAAKGDLEQARQGVIDLWAQIAQGFPGPSPTPEPKPSKRKEHHR
jgi:hypothetical protein